jgi:hypothetical protein
LTSRGNFKTLDERADFLIGEKIQEYGAAGVRDYYQRSSGITVTKEDAELVINRLQSTILDIVGTMQKRTKGNTNGDAFQKNMESNKELQSERARAAAASRANYRYSGDL